jgi:ATP-dependent DNA ligase
MPTDLLELHDFLNSDLTSKHHLVPVTKMVVPSCILINSSVQPDLISPDPRVTNTVFEITGAQFSQSKTHSAAGISLRFPRITRIRDDKDWSDATTLAHLQTLVRMFVY